MRGITLFLLQKVALQKTVSSRTDRLYLHKLVDTDGHLHSIRHARCQLKWTSANYASPASFFSDIVALRKVYQLSSKDSKAEHRLTPQIGSVNIRLAYMPEQGGMWIKAYSRQVYVCV